MGEVYRAEDLTLSQTVALKFLPVAMTRDESARARFHQEVRLAREISHPNVCRVFDIGEFEGRLFLTMEYVDGEDLASLLRRIGQLPQSKGLEIARQMCAGLAVAHEHGVLHRDLKPANIMLDGRGRVRITDFGLAAFAENLDAEELRAGTPAYMAPEQLSGTEVTPRSDIYSLGLVLYEIFTGKKAFDAITLPELLRLREKNTPSHISTLVRDIDPLIERVVLRCLEKDPARRPATALQVAASLPGGDPLAAALAAGETPSPEMVAAAGEKEGLHPAIAWLCLFLTVAGLGAIAFLSNKINLPNFVPLPYSSDVLAARARDVTRQLGYSATPVDAAYGFTTSTEYLDYVKAHDLSKSRWENLSTGVPPVVTFWYRESPQFMVNTSFALTPVVEPDNPPNSISGMCQLFFDTKGNLRELLAVPPELDPSTSAATVPNWQQLFTAAGLDMSSFRPVSSQWTPLVTSDARAAWEGTWPGHRELPLRVEAAAYRGHPVYFALISSWTQPSRMTAVNPSRISTVQDAIVLVILFRDFDLRNHSCVAQPPLGPGRSPRSISPGSDCFSAVIYGLHVVCAPRSNARGNNHPPHGHRLGADCRRHCLGALHCARAAGSPPLAELAHFLEPRAFGSNKRCSGRARFAGRCPYGSFVGYRAGFATSRPRLDG